MKPVLIPASLPPRTKNVGNYRIYLDPRISANQLALFIVSDPSKQESIARDAKRMGKIKVAVYQPARAAVARCYDGNGLNAQSLTDEAVRMEIPASESSFEDDCEKRSAAALRRLIPLVQNIECRGAKMVRPARAFDHLLIENVRVSVQPEVVFSMAHRGVTRFGAVMVNFSKTESLAKKSGKYCAGEYAAFLIFQMLALQFGAEGGPRYGSCFSVDACRDTIHVAPSSHVTMLKHVQAACRAIVRQWSEIPIDAGEEATPAEPWEDF